MKQLSLSEKDRAHAEALIADLSKTLSILAVDIAAEEERTGIYDVSNRAYLLFAKHLRARHDNLRNTVAEIRSRLPPLIDRDRLAC